MVRLPIPSHSPPALLSLLSAFPRQYGASVSWTGLRLLQYVADPQNACEHCMVAPPEEPQMGASMMCWEERLTALLS